MFFPVVIRQGVVLLDAFLYPVLEVDDAHHTAPLARDRTLVMLSGISVMP
jgi:hypothetical protein